jgi:hypothetical protein
MVEKYVENFGTRRVLDKKSAILEDGAAATAIVVVWA